MYLARVVRGGVAARVLGRSVRARIAGSRPQAAKTAAAPCRRFLASSSSSDADFDSFRQSLADAGKAEPVGAVASADTAAGANGAAKGRGAAAPSANADQAAGAAAEGESGDYRQALEEEVLRVQSQRAEYFEVLTKAAAGRLADEALQLVGNMRALSIPLDASSYNAAMVACLDDLDRFEQLRAEMRQDNIPANAATLVITTHVCERNNMFEEAFMLQRDLLNMVSKTLNAERAVRLVEAKLELSSFDVAPTVTLYHALITHELEQGNFRRAYKYVVEMAEKGVKFAYSTVELVVDRCEEAGCRDEAHHIKTLVTAETILNAGIEEEGAAAGEEDRSEQQRDFYKAIASYGFGLPKEAAQDVA